MADAAAPPSEAFRLSMLIYDSRYRSTTIQIVVLILFLLGFFWLANNAVQNLAALGKPINFGFLSQTSGYDINQTLIEYDSTYSHGRATMVGLLNTLLVAFMGCVTATLIGLVGGVLRLSNNWLVSRLVTLYVEIFRNVPVLLWIIVCMLSITSTLPGPRAFRGDDPEASMILFGNVAATNRGIYVPQPFFESGLGSAGMNFLVMAAVIIAGIFFVRWNNKRAGEIQVQTGDRPNTFWVNFAAMTVPFIVLMFVMGLSFERPELRGFNFKGGMQIQAPLIGVWLGLSLYTGTYIVEIVRSGILSVSKGQSEAAAALGIRPGLTMSLVILPQALRVIIPQLISQYLNLTKNSSLGVAVGYADLVATLGTTTLNQSGREMETILLLMAIYLTISLTISGVMNWYNRSVQLVGR
ncbi:MAG: ABC transporter permease subunit [Rhodobacteraceae bacterium]|nr:ABC transporter permease subunit [Paracoccaceae bacterium]